MVNYIYYPGSRGGTTLTDRKSKAGYGQVGLPNRTDAPISLKALDKSEKATPTLSGTLQGRIEKLKINETVEKARKKARAKPITFDPFAKKSDD